MKVLVTGGAGFIGGHLCNVLLGQGHHVVCLDNLQTSKRPNITNRRYTFIHRDVLEPIHGDFHAIYNLACPASPPKYQLDPVHTLRTSVWGMFNVLECARRCGARVVQASTSEVYGSPQVHPQVETYWGNVNPVGVRSCYDEGKRCAETLCVDYVRRYRVDVRIARIFNTYGPGMQPDDGRVVSTLIVQALAGKPLTVFGDGQQTRSFCYVSDTVDALIRLMDPGVGVMPVNVGAPHETTILELVTMVADVTGAVVGMESRALPQDDPPCRMPDITRAMDTLGWRPSVGLQAGLARTVDYFRRVLGRAPRPRQSA